MQAAPLIEWPEPIFQLVDFIGLFLTAGAVGFRYSSLCGTVGGPLARPTRMAAEDPADASGAQSGAPSR